MMDHGVSREYLMGLRRLGYHPSVDDLVRLADHGVSVAFIERMRGHGYTRLSVDDLIRLRDHGF
jgi:archaellum component FlaD/FlaE